MRILNKHSYWWKKEEKEWAWQDKCGNWWISKSEDKKTDMKPPVKKRQKQRSSTLPVETYLAIIGASAVGIILGSLVAMAM